MKKLKISKLATGLPEGQLTNDDLHAEHPDWDMEQVRKRAGVESRRVVGPGETALDLAEKAALSLLAEVDAKQTEALIFCTQTPDYQLPPNSCLLHQRLELEESVLAFDLNMGCSGFVNGLSLAQGLYASGQAQNILLVNADAITPKIHPADRASRTIFGDGAGACWLEAADGDNGILDLVSATAGQLHEKIIIPAGGARNPATPGTARVEEDSSGNYRSAENFFMDGFGVLSFVNTRVPRQVQELMERNQLTVEDVDLFVFHQASRVVLESLSRRLKLPSDKVYSNLKEIGNTFSASIPIALKGALDEGRLEEGSLVVISGFGIGLAWASALVRF